MLTPLTIVSRYLLDSFSPVLLESSCLLVQLATTVLPQRQLLCLVPWAITVLKEVRCLSLANQDTTVLILEVLNQLDSVMLDSSVLVELIMRDSILAVWDITVQLAQYRQKHAQLGLI